MIRLLLVAMLVAWPVSDGGIGAALADDDTAEDDADVADWILRLFRGLEDDARKPRPARQGSTRDGGSEAVSGGRGPASGGGDDGGDDGGGDDGGGDDGGGDDGGDD
jgi:hypothetical protein